MRTASALTYEQNAISQEWAPDENSTIQDEALRQGVRLHGARSWRTIAGSVESRTSTECCQRWRRLQSANDVLKRLWQSGEDRLLVELVKRYGTQQWTIIASHIGGRTNKQCRERWLHQLNPAINKAPWTPDEIEVLHTRQAMYGNRWTKITKELPGRTDNAVKNRWYSTLGPKRQRRSPETFVSRMQEETRAASPTQRDSTSGSDEGLSDTKSTTTASDSDSAMFDDDLAGTADGAGGGDGAIASCAVDPFVEWLSEIALEAWDDNLMNLSQPDKSSQEFANPDGEGDHGYSDDWVESDRLSIDSIASSDLSAIVDEALGDMRGHESC